MTYSDYCHWNGSYDKSFREFFFEESTSELPVDVKATNES